MSYRPSYIYFIGAGSGPVKVGYGQDPWKRMRTFQTGHYERLTLLGMFLPDHAPGLERRLHEAMRPHRLAGEWFRRDRPIEILHYLLWRVEERGANGHTGAEILPDEERSAIAIGEGIIDSVDLFPVACQKVMAA